jgi:hypothetical protein
VQLDAAGAALQSLRPERVLHLRLAGGRV